MELQKVSGKFFSCGEADNSSSRAKCSSSFFFLSHKVQKKVKTDQTNMVAYVIWAINLKSKIRSDLRGFLPAAAAGLQVTFSQKTPSHYV